MGGKSLKLRTDRQTQNANITQNNIIIGIFHSFSEAQCIKSLDNKDTNNKIVNIEQQTTARRDYGVTGQECLYSLDIVATKNKTFLSNANMHFLKVC